MVSSLYVDTVKAMSDNKDLSLFNAQTSSAAAPRRYVTSIIPSTSPQSPQHRSSSDSEPELASADTDSGSPNSRSSSDSDADREDDLINEIQDLGQQNFPTFQQRCRDHRSVRLFRLPRRNVVSVTPWSHRSFRLSRKWMFITV